MVNSVENTEQGPKPGFRLALAGVLLAVVVIGLGAFTRLVDAGLGCPDWPGCYGHLLWPNEAEEIQRANAAYPDMPVEASKTWPEMVHRYFASSLGLLSIFLVAIAVRNRGQHSMPVAHCVFLLGFVILQGLFGMWTVTLKLWPQVVTAHLLGGFTTLALLWLLVLRLSGKPWRALSTDEVLLTHWRSFAYLAFFVLVLQIALGGWTTSNYAAVACPELPTCQGKWWPEMDASAGFNLGQDIGPNYLGGALNNEARVAIHMSHRIGALLTTLLVGTLALVLINRATSPLLKKAGLVLLTVLAIQVALGLSNILFHFPVAVAVAHNLVGAILLLSQLTLLFIWQRSLNPLTHSSETISRSTVLRKEGVVA